MGNWDFEKKYTASMRFNGWDAFNGLCGTPSLLDALHEPVSLPVITENDGRYSRATADLDFLVRLRTFRLSHFPGEAFDLVNPVVVERSGGARRWSGLWDVV